LTDILLQSPNKTIAGWLRYESEIRFGPSYYSLHVRNLGALRNRLFGIPFLWSEDSRYLALQEWISTKESEGPWTRLLLIDFETQLGSQVSGAKSGFIVPARFESQKIVYVKTIDETSTEYEVEIPSVHNWGKLSWEG
jgi:hypothetical protein